MQEGARSWEDRLYLVPAAVSAVTLLVMMMVVAIDVSGRYFFNRPLPAGYEMVQGLMGVLIFSALPLLSRANEHITVGLIDHFFTGRGQRLRIAFVNLFSCLTLVFIAWRLWEHARKLSMNGDATAVLDFPLAPIGWFATALTALSAVAVGLLFVRSLRAPTS
jgi:TRAP-type C4-dicarboxylate transport system permease small subunit